MQDTAKYFNIIKQVQLKYISKYFVTRISLNREIGFKLFKYFFFKAITFTTKLYRNFKVGPGPDYRASFYQNRFPLLSK